MSATDKLELLNTKAGEALEVLKRGPSLVLGVATLVGIAVVGGGMVGAEMMVAAGGDGTLMAITALGSAIPTAALGLGYIGSAINGIGKHRIFEDMKDRIQREFSALLNDPEVENAPEILQQIESNPTLSELKHFTEKHLVASAHTPATEVANSTIEVGASGTPLDTLLTSDSIYKASEKEIEKNNSEHPGKTKTEQVHNPQVMETAIDHDYQPEPGR